ncbi:MAG: hypothetical protein QOD83_1770 [Solirubrobacteraceae bacterium]|jgi:hypothetical protein|nr:hypothetical protein [Solirubrobacteraceae bacterium]
MAKEKLVRRRDRLAHVFLAGVLAIALIAVSSVSDAGAARVIPLPRVTAETYEIDFQGRPAVVLHTLLVRRVHGKVNVSCNKCRRFAARKVLTSSPSRTSRRYKHADWILRGGRAVRIQVTRRGWIGRYLLLTSQRRKGRLGLGYKASGCLSRRGTKISCPRDVPKPAPTIIVVTVPVPAPTVAPPATNGPSAVPAAPIEGVIYAVNQAGELMWYRHGGREDGSLGWSGSKKVGAGWGRFTNVFSGGSGVIYAIEPNGDLIWYRHAGRADGSMSWGATKKVGAGWGSFKGVFSGGHGVIYAIQANGDLIWYRHAGFEDGTWSWLPTRKVGAGWAGFKRVFSGGDGVIYAIKPNGDLFWYRHLGREDGSMSWGATKKVGAGWAGFKDVFSGGDGVIYAVQPNGDLMWYRHLGREDGSMRWSSPKKVGAGWASFKRIVPAPG